MTIGELAATAGVGIETIRFYERRRVLPTPRRGQSGYRRYDNADVWRLAFIRRGKAFGFTLQEIADLLGAGDDRSVDEVRRLTLGRLEAVERELAVLTQRQADLQQLLATCERGAVNDCVDLAAVVDENARE